MKFIDDFLIDAKETRWIGIWIKYKNKYLVILDENVHNWLKSFYGFYIGFK